MVFFLWLRFAHTNSQLHFRLLLQCRLQWQHCQDSIQYHNWCLLCLGKCYLTYDFFFHSLRHKTTHHNEKRKEEGNEGKIRMDEYCYKIHLSTIVCNLIVMESQGVLGKYIQVLLYIFFSIFFLFHFFLFSFFFFFFFD